MENIKEKNIEEDYSSIWNRAFEKRNKNINFSTQIESESNKKQKSKKRKRKIMITALSLTAVTLVSSFAPSLLKRKNKKIAYNDTNTSIEVTVNETSVENSIVDYTETEVGIMNNKKSVPRKDTSSIKPINSEEELIVQKTEDQIIPTVEETHETEEDNTDIEVIDREKEIEIILEKYNLTRFEYESVVYVVFHEVYPNNYDDAYRVINLIYNRTKSISCVNYVSYLTGLDGTSMYAQVIAPNQFVVYNPNYDSFRLENNFDTITYQAVVDFLLSDNSIHNYLSYRATGSKINGGVQFTPNGNVYFDELQPNDIINENNYSKTRKYN